MLQLLCHAGRHGRAPSNAKGGLNRHAFERTRSKARTQARTRARAVAPNRFDPDVAGSKRDGMNREPAGQAILRRGRPRERGRPQREGGGRWAVADEMAEIAFDVMMETDVLVGATPLWKRRSSGASSGTRPSCTPSGPRDRSYDRARIVLAKAACAPPSQNRDPTKAAQHRRAGPTATSDGSSVRPAAP